MFLFGLLLRILNSRDLNKLLLYCYKNNCVHRITSLSNTGISLHEQLFRRGLTVRVKTKSMYSTPSSYKKGWVVQYGG